MNLTKEIQKFEDELSLKESPEILKHLRDYVLKLSQSGLAAKALTTGDKAPMFTLVDMHDREIVFSDLLKQGPVVINFYRGDWCPYCNLELRSFQKALPEISALGATVVSISPQLLCGTLLATEKFMLTFELLSDVGNVVAHKFGLVFKLDMKMIPVYKHFCVDLPAVNGDDSYELPIPATYIIDTHGMIVKDYVNADYTKRLDPEEVIKFLKTMKR